MAMLGEQYEQTIAEMLQKQSVNDNSILDQPFQLNPHPDPPGRGPGARVDPAWGPAAARARHPHRLPEQEQDGCRLPAHQGEERAGGENIHHPIVFQF